jgi:hypothetical protein
MKKWNVYKKGSGEIEVVKEGFNWWAFFFVGLWALTKGLTWMGLIGLFIAILVNRMPSDSDIVAFLMAAALMLVYGFMGNSWVVAKLQKENYSVLIKRIEAASEKGARAKIDDVLSSYQESGT